MPVNKHRYEFNDETEMADVDAALLLALWGTESLHGETAVRTEVRYFLEEANRVCLIDVSTPVGRDLSRLFVGYLRREFGEEAISLMRVDPVSESTSQ